MLGIDKWSHFMVESPQTARSIIFSTFFDASWPKKIKWTANDHHITIFSILNQHI